ncbi:MAG: chemotaxis protein CheD [Halobellus sp.]|uniref:chemotaxis protein CheD n=1 Tax=Halobellus sp. TaxID=1979212 RepID=UPI0035D40EEB
MKVYTSDQSSERSTSERVKVGVADYAVTESGAELVTSGLGSCVGIALVDPVAGVAGLAHAMLPAASDGRSQTDGGGPGPSVNEAKYVDTAVGGLLREMVAAGADRSRIEARIAGGSAMFEFNAGDGAVGQRNVTATKAVLAEHGIPIIATDVGGDHGRSLSFDVSSGTLSVRRAHGDTRDL